MTILHMKPIFTLRFIRSLNFFLLSFSVLASVLLFWNRPSGAVEHPIRSAAEIDYPPFSIVDKKGHAEGFSVELLRAALAAMKRDVTFRIGP